MSKGFPSVVDLCFDRLLDIYIFSPLSQTTYPFKVFKQFKKYLRHYLLSFDLGQGNPLNDVMERTGRYGALGDASLPPSG